MYDKALDGIFYPFPFPSLSLPLSSLTWATSALEAIKTFRQPQQQLQLQHKYINEILEMCVCGVSVSVCMYMCVCRVIMAIVIVFCCAINYIPL